MTSEIFVKTGRRFEWFPNHRKFLDQLNCVVTDSLQIIEQSAGFHGVFASESLRTGQIKLTREEGRVGNGAARPK